MNGKIFTFLICLTLAACGGTRTFHDYARAGDTVAVGANDGAVDLRARQGLLNGVNEQRLTADLSAAADRAASALHLNAAQMLIGVPHDDDRDGLPQRRDEPPLPAYEQEQARAVLPRLPQHAREQESDPDRPCRCGRT